MYSFYCIITTIFLFASTIDAMQKTGDNTPLQSFYVPADVKTTIHETSYDELLTIEDENALSDEGTITSLVFRPEKDYRHLVSMLQLNADGVEGDFIPDNCKPREIFGVTVMRADVSRALGGAHIPGDNIHVQGLRMGKDYLHDGDLLVIKDSVCNTIKALLVKTLAPHYACWKLKARCGSLAFDCLHAEDQFEHHPTIKNGLLQRLRGIRLAVLHEGQIHTGDRVALVKDGDKEKLLSDYQAHEKYNHLLDISKAEAAKMEASEAAKVALRKNMLLKKSVN